MKNNKTRSGMTVIELLVAIAVFETLSIIAINNYKDYTIKSQISEGIVLGDQYKYSISEYYAVNGRVPESNSDVQINAVFGKYVSNINISNGVIAVLYGNDASYKIKGSYIFMFPYLDKSNVIQWDCKYPSTINQRYVPATCTPLSGNFSTQNGQIQ